MSQTLSIPVGAINHTLLEGLTACVKTLDGVGGAKLVGGQLEVTASAGVTKKDVVDALLAAHFHWVLSSVDL